ncbi:MAG TPA: multicopper oxidase domain-containing protein, partial [Miltoncostaea sp.]|nr:multicopper oxidase domain-containing protein [Miltoncostaea sp.]
MTDDGDDQRKYRIRPRHTVRVVVGLFLTGLVLGGVLVGMGAASNGSTLETTAADAATPPATAAAATPAAGGTSTSHAGMDMGAGASSATTTPVAADTPAQPANRAEPYGATPLRYTMDGNVKVFHLTAAPVTWRVDETHTMEAWAYNGQVPGPVIRARVGDRIRIVVTNHLPEATTIHWHGVALPISQDGVPGISQKPIEPGTSFTYEFDLKAPGLAMYHPHFNTLAQQSKGLYGTLIVDPAEGPPANTLEAFQVLSEGGGQFLINGKSFPSTDAYHVKVGQKVRVHVLNLGEMDHPMHLHGFLFTVVGADGGVIP